MIDTKSAIFSFSHAQPPTKNNKIGNKLFAYMIAMIFAIILIASALLCSCTPSTTSTSGQKHITDAYGRDVAIPNTVNKVATVGSATRFVVYAGHKNNTGLNKLVAITEMDTPSTPNRPYTYALNNLAASGLPPTTNNGNHLNETSVDTEKMLEIKPDVIISSRSAEECNRLQSDTSIPVVGISYQGQLFSDNVYKSIEVVGEVLGTKDEATETTNKMKQWAKELDTMTAANAKKQTKSVYVGGINYKGAKGITGTYANYAPLQAINATNIADDYGQNGSFEFNLEELGIINPDYIFLNYANSDLIAQEYTQHKSFFDSLKAFQNKNLFTQPSFNYNGTNIELGICDAYYCGKVLYPDEFSNINLNEKYNEIFSTLIGQDYNSITNTLGENDFNKYYRFGAYTL